MTTPIQAAIEALTRWTMKINGDNPSMEESPDGNWYWREDVHRAVLQAAQPVQGSIDTPEFHKLLLTWESSMYPHSASALRNLITHIDAHIAQRAPVADAPKLVPVRDAALIARVQQARRSVGTIRDADEAMLARQAAPAPIADEVAGEWVLVPVEPTDEMREACTRNSYCDDIDADWASMLAARPPAPKASAPDAPAGHAEPVAWGFDGFGTDEVIYATEPHDSRRWTLSPDGWTPLFAAPVAAEPAPADPMDWKLPCDVPVGSGKHHKGATLRTLVLRIEGLHRMAMRALPQVTPEQRAAFEALFVDIPAQPGMICWCATCRPITLDDMRMVLRPTCGNKRCPRAAGHQNDCTSSNEPGQTGSSHE